MYLYIGYIRYKGISTVLVYYAIVERRWGVSCDGDTLATPPSACQTGMHLMALTAARSFGKGKAAGSAPTLNLPNTSEGAFAR